MAFYEVLPGGIHNSRGVGRIVQPGPANTGIVVYLTYDADTDAEFRVSTPTGVLDTRFREGNWDKPDFICESSYTHSPSGNTAAKKYYDGVPNYSHIVYRLDWGYSRTPSGNGSIYIQAPSGTTIWGPMPILAGGPGFHSFENGLRAPPGASLNIVLSQGGEAVSGVLSVPTRKLE